MLGPSNAVLCASSSVVSVSNIVLGSSDRMQTAWAVVETASVPDERLSTSIGTPQSTVDSLSSPVTSLVIRIMSAMIPMVGLVTQLMSVMIRMTKLVKIGPTERPILPCGPSRSMMLVIQIMSVMTGMTTLITRMMAVMTRLMTLSTEMLRLSTEMLRLSTEMLRLSSGTLRRSKTVGKLATPLGRARSSSTERGARRSSRRAQHAGTRSTPPKNSAPIASHARRFSSGPHLNAFPASRSPRTTALCSRYQRSATSAAYSRTSFPGWKA